MRGRYRVVEKDGSVHEYSERASGPEDGFLLFVNEEEIAYLGPGGFITGDQMDSVTYFGSVGHHLLRMRKGGQAFDIQCHPPRLSLGAKGGRILEPRNEVRLNAPLTASVERMIEGRATQADLSLIEVTRRVVRLTKLHT